MFLFMKGRKCFSSNADSDRAHCPVQSAPRAAPIAARKIARRYLFGQIGLFQEAASLGDEPVGIFTGCGIRSGQAVHCVEIAPRCRPSATVFRWNVAC
jgi:hypothetical protein